MNINDILPTKRKIEINQSINHLNSIRCSIYMTKTIRLIIILIHFANSQLIRSILSLINSLTLTFLNTVYITYEIHFELQNQLSFKWLHVENSKRNFSVGNWDSTLMLLLGRLWCRRYNIIFIDVWWCLTPLSTIFQWWSFLLVEETGGHGENHRPVTSHWQTLSHNVVHLALIEIRIHNVSGDRH
jgi:hypothetical protein